MLAPSTDCHVVKEWLAQHPEITLLPYPPQSPDLNPIENVWSAMTQRMPMTHPRRRESVVMNALEAWEELGSTARRVLTTELLDSVPMRLSSLIEVVKRNLNKSSMMGVNLLDPVIRHA
ncbi:Transposable element Tc1 transposase-like 11 [Homarus americanus]|uniref:Transposable element Tc1 transposase-like 11 n=1 Tax=Homarus americanus TaxID=6706 RepID=A0A8J5K4L7_HOMAM|nr:Transposable element Tc1 transposase-like 11 [Homarus americanus]